MQLVVLVAHFARDVVVSNFETAEAFEVVVAVEEFATLSDLLQKLVPVVYVVTKLRKHFVKIYVPKGLVWLPGVKVVDGITEYFLQGFISLSNVELFTHF